MIRVEAKIGQKRSTKPDAGDPLLTLDDASLLHHHIMLLATSNNWHPVDAAYVQRSKTWSVTEWRESATIANIVISGAVRTYMMG